MSEKILTPEKREVSDQELIDALKSKGAEDSDVSRLLLRWTEQGEKKV